MAENSAQKRKEENKANVWDTIADLIERGRKPPTREELNELMALGKSSTKSIKKETKTVVPELKPTEEALAASAKLRHALDEAARHEDTGMLKWS